MFRTFLILTTITTGLVLALQLEPNREGIIHNSVRGRTMIKSEVLPKLTILSPQENWTGQFIVKIDNFDYQPNLATNPISSFANGFQEVNRGHVHGWVFNSEGIQVRFYGAAGTTYEKPLYIKPDEFPPGVYTAYFQLQNHDHTPVIPALAPQFPAIASVKFIVTEEQSGIGIVNVPNCGCGKLICESE